MSEFDKGDTAAGMRGQRRGSVNAKRGEERATIARERRRNKQLTLRRLRQDHHLRGHLRLAAGLADHNLRGVSGEVRGAGGGGLGGDHLRDRGGLGGEAGEILVRLGVHLLEELGELPDERLGVRREERHGEARGGGLRRELVGGDVDRGDLIGSDAREGSGGGELVRGGAVGEAAAVRAVVVVHVHHPAVHLAVLRAHRVHLLGRWKGVPSVYVGVSVCFSRG